MPIVRGERKEETTKPCPNTILSRMGDYFLSHCIRTIVSDEADEERTCLLGGGAGRSSDRSSYRGIESRVLIAHVWSMHTNYATVTISVVWFGCLLFTMKEKGLYSGC